MNELYFKLRDAFVKTLNKEDHISWHNSKLLNLLDSIVGYNPEQPQISYNKILGRSSFANGSGNQLIELTQNVISKITNSTGDLYNISDSLNITSENDSFIIQYDGYYTIHGMVSFEGRQGSIMRIHLMKNGNTICQCSPSIEFFNNRIVNLNSTDHVYLEEGDEIYLGISNQTDNQDTTVRSSRFFIYNNY